MPKLDEWLVKVRIKLTEKEKKLLRRQANGFPNIREVVQLVCSEAVDKNTYNTHLIQLNIF